MIGQNGEAVFCNGCEPGGEFLGPITSAKVTDVHFQGVKGTWEAEAVFTLTDPDGCATKQISTGIGLASGFTQHEIDVTLTGIEMGAHLVVADRIKQCNGMRPGGCPGVAKAAMEHLFNDGKTD